MTICEYRIESHLIYGRRFRQRGPLMQQIATRLFYTRSLDPALAMVYSALWTAMPHSLSVIRKRASDKRSEHRRKASPRNGCTTCVWYEDHTTAEEKSSLSCEALEFLFLFVCAVWLGDHGCTQLFPSKDGGCPSALLYGTPRQELRKGHKTCHVAQKAL